VAEPHRTPVVAHPKIGRPNEEPNLLGVHIVRVLDDFGYTLEVVAGQQVAAVSSGVQCVRNGPGEALEELAQPSDRCLGCR
jgi:hypothetical protein